MPKKIKLADGTEIEVDDGVAAIYEQNIAAAKEIAELKEKQIDLEKQVTDTQTYLVEATNKPEQDPGDEFHFVDPDAIEDPDDEDDPAKKAALIAKKKAAVEAAAKAKAEKDKKDEVSPATRKLIAENMIELANLKVERDVPGLTQEQRNQIIRSMLKHDTDAPTALKLERVLNEELFKDFQTPTEKTAEEEAAQTHKKEVDEEVQKQVESGNGPSFDGFPAVEIETTEAQEDAMNAADEAIAATAAEING